MAEGRFDTSALTGRVRGAGWRHFRAEAIAGEHGQDLVARHWWKRAEFAILALLCTIGTVVFPLILLTIPEPGVVEIVGLVCLSAGSAASGLFGLGLGRQTFWGPRARGRYRLTVFARANDLTYQADPDIGRHAAHIFTTGPKRRHHDHFQVPGPQGFDIANYEEWWPDSSETTADKWGYAVFRLRESYPHTLLIRGRWSVDFPRGLREIEPTDGPVGWQMLSRKPDHPLLQRLLASGVIERALSEYKPRAIEIVDNELFLLYGRFLPLHTPRLWQQVASVAEAVAPFIETEIRENNWLFGPNTGFPATNGSAVSLTRGSESYTLGGA